MVASALQPAGLYHPRDEHDSCGVGFVVDIKGRQSHGIIAKGLQILLNLLHRGACGCEATTGDGAGVLVQMPDRFMRKVTSGLDFALPPAGRYGAGLVFLPRDRDEREQLRTLIRRTVEANGHTLLGWRPVPGDDSCLGASARAAKPVIEQVFIADRKRPVGDAAAGRDRFERSLFIIRKQIEHAADRLSSPGRCAFYIVSLSANTLTVLCALPVNPLIDSLAQVVFGFCLFIGGVPVLAAELTGQNSSQLRKFFLQRRNLATQSRLCNDTQFSCFTKVLCLRCRQKVGELVELHPGSPHPFKLPQLL